MTRLMQVLIFLNYSLSAMGLVFWAFIFYRLIYYPENYMGFSPLWGLTVFVALLPSSLTCGFYSGFSRYFGIMAFALASCLALWGLDYFNLLMAYETWLSRGMPDRPF